MNRLTPDQEWWTAEELAASGLPDLPQTKRDVNLRVVQKASPGHGRKAIYRLIRNTGPLPPQIQRVKHVFDPNTREVHMPENGA